MQFLFYYTTQRFSVYFYLFFRLCFDSSATCTYVILAIDNHLPCLLHWLFSSPFFVALFFFHFLFFLVWCCGSRGRTVGGRCRRASARAESLWKTICRCRHLDCRCLRRGFPMEACLAPARRPEGESYRLQQYLVEFSTSQRQFRYIQISDVLQLTVVWKY